MKTLQIEKVEKLISEMNEICYKMQCLNKELQLNLRNSIEENNQKYSVALTKLENLPQFIAENYYAILNRNNITMRQIFFDDNITAVVMCRHEIHYVLHTFYAKKKNSIRNNESYLTIDNISELTGRTHSMALNSIRVMNNEFDTQPKYKSEFMEFFNSLKPF
jgi:hypothetical protein